MKKYICVFALILLCAFSLCACNRSDDNSDDAAANNSTVNVPPIKDPEQNAEDKHINGEVTELLTVEDLVDFHLKGEKYPENFVFKELSGYGRVLNSAASREQALAIAEEHFTNKNCTPVKNELVVETDLFYGSYIKWAYRSNETAAPYYYDEYVVSFKPSVYDYENNLFYTRDKDKIKKILDYVYYSRTYQLGGAKIYSSDIFLKDDKYEYVLYSLGVSYGDWGVQDQLYFIKETHKIDLISGRDTFSREVVGNVYIDGNFTHGGIMVDG